MTDVVPRVFCLRLDPNGFVLGSAAFPKLKDSNDHLQAMGFTEVTEAIYTQAHQNAQDNWQFVNGELVDQGTATWRLTRDALESRNNLLLGSDWTTLSDVDLTEEQKTEWRAYRQALRDITDQTGFPQQIEWPVSPRKKA